MTFSILFGKIRKGGVATQQITYRGYFYVDTLDMEFILRLGQEISQCRAFIGVKISLNPVLF